MSKFEFLKIPGIQKNGDYIELRRTSTTGTGLPDNIFIREANEDCTQLAIHKRLARQRMITHMQYEVRRYRAGKLIAKGLFKNNPRSENEVLAYEICKAYGIPCCVAEMARWKGTTGCISWYDLRIDENGETIDGYIEGEGITTKYIRHKEETTGEEETRDEKDLSLILDVIDFAIRDHYAKSDISEEELMKRIKKVRADVIAMAMFDRLHGNGDRHNNNWGLKLLGDTKDLEFYPLFDNEDINGTINIESFIMDVDRVAHILKAYPDEAESVFKSITTNFAAAVKAMKAVKTQTRKDSIKKVNPEAPTDPAEL